jgi:long-chain acyl-CoA synthetase
MSSTNTTHLGERIRAVLLLKPDGVAVEVDRTRTTWADLDRAAGEIERLLQQAGVEQDAPIGWVARNRVAAVASFASLLMNGRMVVPLRPPQTSATFAVELGAQRLCAVLADEEDWAEAGVVKAAAEAGTFGVVVSGSAQISVSVHPALSVIGNGPHRQPTPGYVLERLTSGTTGAPKRIPVREEVLIPSLQSAEHGRLGEAKRELSVKRSAAILLKPFSHAGGLFGLLLALYQARPMVLLEKFSPDDWAHAIERHQIKSASLVPAMIQMILEAGIEPDLLRSLKAVRAGTAPLDPQVQVDFEERYGVPVLVDYGAAEFIGGVAGWTLDDHRQYASTKRRSVGRARGDVSLKVTAQDSVAALAPGEVGVLCVKCDRFGPDWIRTNDLASIDEQGFLFLHGRADDAINRGGFKILPEEVAEVLRRYPGVRDAAVIGKADKRLGQVPVAAIEMAPGAVVPTTQELDAFTRLSLTAYMIPTEFRIVEALPRTASMKVSRPELKALLGL